VIWLKKENFIAEAQQQNAQKGRLRGAAEKRSKMILNCIICLLPALKRLKTRSKNGGGGGGPFCKRAQI